MKTSRLSRTGRFLLVLHTATQVGASHVAFRHVGDVWHSAGDVHVAFRFSLAGPRNECYRFGEAFQQLKNVTAGPHLEEERMWTEALERSVQLACKRLNALPELHTGSGAARYPEDRRRPVGRRSQVVQIEIPSFHVRRKRFIATLATAVFSGISSFIGGIMYSHSAVSNRIAAIASDLRATRRSFQKTVNLIQKRQHMNTYLGLLTTEITAFNAHAATLVDSYNTLAFQYRLDNHLLPLADARRLLSDLTGSITTFHFPFPPQALYELPASFIVHRNAIEAVLKIPLIQFRLDLFEYHPFPLRAISHPVMLIPRDSSSLIAVNTQQSQFYRPTQFELDGCLHLGQGHVCGFPYLNQNLDGTCLSALFTGHWPAAERLCSTVLCERPWVLTPAGGDRWLLFTNTSLAFKAQCANGTRTVGTWKPGFQNFQVSRECELTATVFHIPVKPELSVSVTVITREFPTEKVPNWTDEDPLLKLSPLHPVKEHAIPIGIGSGVFLFAVCALVLCCYLYKVAQRAPA